LSLYELKFSDYENCYNEIKAITNKCLSDKKSKASNNNQARTLKRTENKTLDDLNFNSNSNKNEIKKKFKSFEKELNDNNDRTGKKVVKVETQRKLNLKQKFGANQLKIHLFPSNNLNQAKKKFGVMNILSIKNLKHESDKVYQTEGETTAGRSKQLFTINKNGLFINYLKDKKN